MRKGIVAADVAAAYGIEDMSGCIILGGMPYRSMHPHVAHPVIMSLIPGLLSENIAEFSVAVQGFAASCVSESFEIPEEDRLAWIGGVALQVSHVFTRTKWLRMEKSADYKKNPLVRQHSIARTQDEGALLAAKGTFPFLVIHGVEDRHMYVDKLEAFMKGNFGNVEFHRVEGVGHAPFYEVPEFVNRTVLDFVKKQVG